MLGIKRSQASRRQGGNIQRSTAKDAMTAKENTENLSIMFLCVLRDVCGKETYLNALR